MEKENSTTGFSKNTRGNRSKYFKTWFALFVIALAITGCKKKDTTTTTPSYQQVNLVADSAGYNGARIDTNLKNAWGIAIGGTGSFWIASNHGVVSTIYDRNGVQVLAPVSLKPNGAPTGIVYNNTTGFNGSKFIFAGEDGIISSWTSGTSTSIAADRSGIGAVYKGLAIATDGGANFLYATDFKNSRVDVFDAGFNYVSSKPFTDPSTTNQIPSNYGPFNISNIDGKLYVSYAMHKGPDNEDDQSGIGNGFVNIFNADGSFVKRFASQGTLNSPWGLAAAPSGFGLGDGMILVGNFGDGRINVYDANGVYKSQLMDNGSAITIEGLWALQFPVNNLPAGDQNQLFFTAGPGDEEHGLFGYIKKR
ncbi:MAG: hypothetical protein JWO06_958 [Bacteroidota bacterium]|nr:hypothetical protein [Bacteroidota bacterium]